MAFMSFSTCLRVLACLSIGLIQVWAIDLACSYSRTMDLLSMRIDGKSEALRTIPDSRKRERHRGSDYLEGWKTYIGGILQKPHGKFVLHARLALYLIGFSSPRVDEPRSLVVFGWILVMFLLNASEIAGNLLAGGADGIVFLQQGRRIFVWDEE